MEIYNLFPGSFGSNCYVLISGTEAAVVDPSADAELILQKIAQKGATLRYILLTHGHFDHICSLDTLRQRSGVPAYVHVGDVDMPEDAYKNAFYFFFAQERSYRTPEKLIGEGEILPLGEESIRVISTPGHTNGSVCFLCGEDLLLTGDTIFANGYGRCDLYGGSPAKLRFSLERLSELDPTLTIYPGHGSPANLGDALKSCTLI